MSTSNSMNPSKLRKLLIDGEQTVGTYEPLTSNTFIVPVTTFPTMAIDRGKAMIDRTGLFDGQAGDVDSIRGSSAWSATFDMELHDPGSKYNYWALFMLGCGFQLEEQTDTPGLGDTSALFTLSNKVYANFNSAATDHPPITLSATVVQNRNETDDYAMRMRGTTGVATFNLATGDTAKLSVAAKGLVVNAALDADDFLDNSDIDVSGFGTTSNWATPFVVKNINLTILDETSTPRTICLQSITVNINSNHPDFECPSEEYGFEISPVFHDTSPTVDLEFPDGSEVQPWVFAQFRSGAVFSLQAELISGSGRNLFFNFNRLQFQTVTLGDSGGFVNYSVSTKAVRDPGQPASSLMQVLYIYSPA